MMILYVCILSHIKSERPRFSRGFPNLAEGFFSLVFNPGFSEFIMGVNFVFPIFDSMHSVTLSVYSCILK